MSHIIVPIGKNSGPVTIDIKVGHPIFAQFQFTRYDENGRNPQIVFQGINSDTIPDTFTVDAISLSNSFLHCQFMVHQHQVQPGARYKIDVIFRQGQSEIYRMSAGDSFTAQSQYFVQLIKFV